MNIIILAAGRGNRLGFPCPKALAPLNTDLTILDWQLRCIETIFPLSNVIVVVGFAKELIVERYPQLKTVVNPDFASENTAKSLMRALEAVEGDVIWMNGDVVAHPSVFQKIAKHQATCLVVNKAAIGEEEVKYRTDTTSGLICELSKEVLEAEGESLGINRFQAADVPRLKQKLALCQKMDYFERGIEFCIAEGLAVEPLPIDTDSCVEVDFPADLERARVLIQQWNDADF